MTDVRKRMPLRPPSRKTEARVAGVLYLLNLLTGIAAMLLLSRKMQGAGDAMNMIASVLYTGVTLLFWHLFFPVQAWISSVAALVSLLGCWLPLARFQAPHQTLHITYMAFFGVYCVLLSSLILRSKLMSKVVGTLVLCAGLCELTTMLPRLSYVLGPVPLIGALIGEGSLIVFLLVWGVRDHNSKARPSGEYRQPGS